MSSASEEGMGTRYIRYLYSLQHTTSQYLSAEPLMTCILLLLLLPIIQEEKQEE